MNQNSPEDKLLNLIRRSKPKPAPAQEMKPTVVPKQASSAQKEKNKAQSKTGLKLLLWLRRLPASLVSSNNLGKLIYLFGALSAVFLLTSLLYPYVGLRHIKLPQISPEAAAKSAPLAHTEQEPLEAYLRSARQRSIFNSPQKAEVAAPMVAADVNFIKDIALLG